MRTLLLLALLATLPCRAASVLHLDVQGTEFIVTLPDGSQRRSAELAGAVLALPDGRSLRIDTVERETLAQGDAIWLHALSVRTADGWESLCQTDGAGRSLGFPFQGRFTDDGNYLAADGLFSLSCTSGAQAKCIRYGYAPWKVTADGASLSGHYNACIRMIRADYCGDQAAHTMDGTVIDIYDDLRVQDTDASITDMRFEAGWGPHGAVCVAHTRIPALLDLAALRADCPTLAAIPQGQACNEAWARAHGAILFNRSR